MLGSVNTHPAFVDTPLALFVDKHLSDARSGPGRAFRNPILFNHLLAAVETHSVLTRLGVEMVMELMSTGGSGWRVTVLRKR